MTNERMTNLSEKTGEIWLQIWSFVIRKFVVSPLRFLKRQPILRLMNGVWCFFWYSFTRYFFTEVGRGAGGST